MREVTPLDLAVMAAAWLCVIFFRAILTMPDNPAILDVFPDRTDAHQAPNWQSEFRW